MWEPTQNGSELYHYGVIGMKWGVHKARSYNNKMLSNQFRQASIHERSPLGRKDPRIAKLDVKNAEYADKRSAAAKDVITKSNAHLNKINAKYNKAQRKADAKYQKAERKANSLFATKKSADRAFRKAAKAQYKANKIAYKGKRFYEQLLKSTGLDDKNPRYRKRNIFYGELDPETKALGKSFVDRVERSSKAMYAISYAGG